MKMKELATNYELTDIPVGKRSYAFDNELSRAPKLATANMWKLFGLILSEIEYTKGDNDLSFNVSMKDIREACGVQASNYRFYTQALRDLAKDTIVTYETDYYRIISPFIKKIKVPKQINNFESKEIEITINEEFRHFIENLQSGYSRFKLAETRNFRSKYSFPIYAFLTSYRQYNYWDKDKMAIKPVDVFITTKQLKSLLTIPKEAYVSKGHFNRTVFEKKVIIPALEEINKYTNMKVVFKKEKMADSVRSYHFYFVENIEDGLSYLQDLIKRKNAFPKCDRTFNLVDEEDDEIITTENKKEEVKSNEAPLNNDTVKLDISDDDLPF